MKTYTVLFAEDVPFYGTVEIEAADDDAALEIAKSCDVSDAATDPEWCNSACKRIVRIEDAERLTVAEDISLDDCFLRYGGEKDRLLCEAAPELLSALKQILENGSMHDDGTFVVNEGTGIEEAYAAIAKASRGSQ